MIFVVVRVKAVSTEAHFTFAAASAGLGHFLETTSPVRGPNFPAPVCLLLVRVLDRRREAKLAVAAREKLRGVAVGVAPRHDLTDWLQGMPFAGISGWCSSGCWSWPPWDEMRRRAPSFLSRFLDPMLDQRRSERPLKPVVEATRVVFFSF